MNTERITEIVDEWSSGTMSAHTAMAAISLLVHEQNLTDEDLEWAKKKLEALKKRENCS
jgi:hypothetical protein